MSAVDGGGRLAGAHPGEPDDAVDPRVHFAAERTLLAWVRTGLAMMGFGFVVARFGLFLHQIAAVQGVPPLRQGLSLWVGVSLVGLGVVVNIAAALRHRRTIQRLEKGLPLQFPAVSLGTVVALLLGLLGVAMAAYLVLGLQVAPAALQPTEGRVGEVTPGSRPAPG